jgi:hypothetical protein
MGKRAREFAAKFFSPGAYRQGYGQLIKEAEKILVQNG